jgi:biotin carboxylase
MSIQLALRGRMAKNGKRALLLAFACRQQYHVLRAAAAAGYSVHVLGKDCARGLKYSRYCAGYQDFNFDAVFQSPGAALAEITRHAERVKADVILPSDIVSTRLLSALAGHLPTPTCALPDPACFDMLNDKWRFYQFCREHGVRVPQTWLFEDAERLRAAVREGSVSFPFIIKPHNAMGGQGIHRIQNSADLHLLESAKYKSLLVQKLIVGDEIDISLLAHKGRIGVYAIQRNLPERYVFVRHEQLLAQAARAAEAGKFHGLAHFDAIEEKATGDIYLIECNPRAWYSIFAATVSGLNFIKLSLETEKLELDNPPCIADTYVPTSRSTLALVKKIIKKRGIDQAELRLLAYDLADPQGKRYSMQPSFDDMLLPPSSPGSVSGQIAALAAMGAWGTA